MDGYLKNAFVFLDLNDDGTYSANEPNTTTSDNGTYSLIVSNDAYKKHAIIAVAIAGTTIDSDNPNIAVNQQYSLTTPIGKSNIISPITTLVSAKLNSGMTLTEAENAVKSEIRLTDIDLYKDYVAAKNADPAYKQAHNIAAAVTEILKSVELTSSAFRTLSEKLSSVNVIFTSTDFQKQIPAIKEAVNTSAAANIASTSLTNPQAQAQAQVIKRILNSVTTIIAVTSLAM